MIVYPLSGELQELINDLGNLEIPKGVAPTYFMTNRVMKYILMRQKTIAFKALSNILLGETLDKVIILFNERDIDSDDYSLMKNAFFKEILEVCGDLKEVQEIGKINSGFLLYAMLIQFPELNDCMKKFMVTPQQLMESVINVTNDSIDEPIKHQKKKRTKLMRGKQKLSDNGGDTENHLKNLNKLAAEGKVAEIYDNDDSIMQCLRILSKKEHNNVIIVGDTGVGKTGTVRHIANMIDNEECPNCFKDKILMEMDFSSLIMGTALKGLFEQKFHAILKDASHKGNYIFFIDNIDNLLSERTHISETNIESLLELLVSEPNIPIIATSRTKGYDRIVRNSPLSRFFDVVHMEKCDSGKTEKILNEIKGRFERFHGVEFTKKAIHLCSEMASKYATDKLGLPALGIEWVDELGAMVSIVDEEETTEMITLQEQLADIQKEKEDAKNSMSKDYDIVDRLTSKEIELKGMLSVLEKKQLLNKKNVIIDEQKVLEFLSQKYNKPIENLDNNEKQRLRGLSDEIKESIIGQNEAVEEVCRAVKRQRVGLGEPERPTVMMFLGSTGTGKTYLAKHLAKKVFGGEEYLVRIDMSEYSDKTSVNKITGSANGYVGYEDETLLVRELKKKKNFVLLLDEFEKCNEEVHNIFLQIFDEGRFTDNHGTTYDMRDLIIIMTSNVGVAEADRRGKQIGFGNGDEDFSKSIIEREMKNKFNPEFLNRVQATVFFNRLSDDNLRTIIEIEIKKLVKKVNARGYEMDASLTKGQMVDDIYNAIIQKKEFGARPIVYEVQRQIEDKIVDYIIEHDIDEGHLFTYDELKVYN